jgi:hypothetical protein
MMRLILCLLLLVGTSALAGGPSPVESRKIVYLIASVESLKGAEFIRNGTAYDGKAAAEHLRMKLQNAGSRVTTADDFIRLCASASSMSGTPYLIRYSDGRVVTSEGFFKQRLAELAQ